MIDPLRLPDSDSAAGPAFSPTASLARAVQGFLTAALIDAAPQRDRNDGEPYAAPQRVLEGVYRFDGDPLAAILAGLESRDDADDGTAGLAFALVGYEQTAQRRRATNAAPRVQALPLSVIVCRESRPAVTLEDGAAARTRAAQIQADAEAIDIAADLVAFFLSVRFVAPHAWGLAGIEPGDILPGAVDGIATPVSIRRLPFTLLRTVAR